MKNNKCTSCFACPYCQNILALTEDPKTKLKILLCQFCYWNSKEINMKEEKFEVLLENVSKLSNKLREQDLKIYSLAHALFKESNLSLEAESKAISHHVTPHKKNPSSKNYVEESNFKNKEQIDKLSKSADLLIRRTTLEEESEEYVGNENKCPQAITLLNKKVRRCPNPNCNKPFTNLYRPSRSTEPKIELMYKELKILQAQRLPPADNLLKIKFLRKATLFGKEYEPSQVETVQLGKEFEVRLSIENKTRGTTTDVLYTFIV